MAYIPSLIPPEDLANYGKSAMGSRVGLGRRAAILVVDMTRAFVEDAYPLGYSRTGIPCSQAIRTLLDRARPLGTPVFYTKGAPASAPAESGRWLDKGSRRHGEDSPMERPEAHEVVEILAPRPGEVVITKNKPSAFFGTQLVSMLNYLGVDTVIVTGMVTSGCIRATAVDAFSYNYRVIVPVECVADRGQIPHEVNLFDIDMKYGDVVPLADVLAEFDKLAATR